MKSSQRVQVKENRTGFSLVELLITLALAALIFMALQEVLIAQRKFYETQGAVSARNETVRTSMAVLGAALREASVPHGDIQVLTPRRIRVRMPVGLGVVCGIDNNGSRIGLVAPQGRWDETVGDSVVVHLTSGRLVDLLDQVDPTSDRVPCLTSSPGLIIRLDQRVPNVAIPSPARAFRSQLLESVVENGKQYLYRVDGAERDLLVGPLDLSEGFRAWYVDLQGVEVFDPTLADRVMVRVIAQSPDVRGVPSFLRDTLEMSFGGRN
jgi:prepilin-type N-terminal cleavage/methylation domain-containing protein